MRKKLMFAFALVLAGMLVGLGLTACSNPFSEEHKAKAAVEQCIKEITAADDEAAAQLLGESFCEVAERAGISPADVSKALFSHLKVDVSPASIDGIGGTCDVTLTNSDFAQAMRNYNAELLEWQSSADLSTLVSEGGNEALAQKILEILIENLGSNDLETATTSVTALLIQDPDGSWRVENADAISKALLSGSNLTTMF